MTPKLEPELKPALSPELVKILDELAWLIVVEAVVNATVKKLKPE